MIKDINGSNAFVLTRQHCNHCMYNNTSVFDKDVDFSKCKDVKKISFGKSFNKSIDNKLPFLEILEFGEKFNQSVENLPLHKT